MNTLNEIENVLAQHKKELRAKFKVKEIRIFGSCLTGKQKKTSDIDVLVDFEEEADLFHLVGLALFLEEKLHQKVDVVPKRALREEIKESILKEAISI